MLYECNKFITVEIVKILIEKPREKHHILNSIQNSENVSFITTYSTLWNMSHS